MGRALRSHWALRTAPSSLWRQSAAPWSLSLLSQLRLQSLLMLRKSQKPKTIQSSSAISPASSSTVVETSAARSRRQYEMTRDGAIVFFSTWKDISEATEVLAPLKATCGLLVRALEMTKSINDNKKNMLEFRDTLSSHLTFFVKCTADSGPRQDLLGTVTKPYETEMLAISKEVLKEAELLESKPGIKLIFKRIGTARIDVDKLKSWTDRLTAAHRNLTTSLQFIISHQLGDVSVDVKAIGHDVKSLAASRPANFGRESLNRSFYGMDLDGCDSGTRIDVLNRIRHWAEDSLAKQIFWLCAGEGSGKTSIAVTMFKEWDDKGLLGGRFFFSKDAKATSTTHEFCHVVARDLASHIPPLQSIIEDALKCTPKSHYGLEQQLSRAVIGPLERYDKPTIIVIDGLDAVSDAHMRHRFLECLIKELPRAPMLKVFFSSRSEMDIEEVLGKASLVEPFVYLPNVTDGSIDPDITLYIEKRLKNLGVDVDGQTSRISIIASLSKGSFLWLVPATFLLKHSKTKQILLEKLSNAGPSGHLDELYRISLSQITHGMWPSELKMDLLQVIITALDPMPLQTIYHFVPHRDKDIALILQKGFGGLLKHGGPDALVHIRHSNFRSFCINSIRAKEFYVDLALSHKTMASKCIHLLESRLHYNVLDIDIPGDTPEVDLPPLVLPMNDHISNLHRVIKEKMCPGMTSTSSAFTYASSYWPYHVSEAQDGDDLIYQTTRFLKTQLLCWVELMSWRGCIDEVVDGLSYLQIGMHSSKPQYLEMKDLVSQALSFVTDNRVTIEQSALQVYCSALGFSKTSGSLIEHYRKVYKGRCPTVAQHDPPPTSENISVLELSPDGKLIAIASSDFTVELRQVPSLEVHEQRLFGHQAGISSLSFSHESHYLASGSADGQVRIWKLATGSQIYLIEQAGAIARITFLENGLFVISTNGRAGEQSTLRVWNIPQETEGQAPSARFTCKEPFEIAAFSSESSRLAAATGQGIFEIRDATNGGLLFTGDTGIHPSSITLSPDSARMAISDGAVVQLWNLTTPPVRIAEISIEMTRNKNILSLSISSNGKYLVYGSTIWDIEGPSPILWHGHRLPRSLQTYKRGPLSFLSYNDDWIESAHPRGCLVRVPPSYNIHPETIWRSHGSRIVFAPEGQLIIVDCSTLLP